MGGLLLDSLLLLATVLLLSPGPIGIPVSLAFSASLGDEPDFVFSATREVQVLSDTDNVDDSGSRIAPLIEQLPVDQVDNAFICAYENGFGSTDPSYAKHPDYITKPQKCTCDGHVVYGKRFLLGSDGDQTTLDDMVKTRHVMEAVDGGFPCTSQFMGVDPLPGVAKMCVCLPVPSSILFDYDFEDHIKQEGNQTLVMDAGDTLRKKVESDFVYKPKVRSVFEGKFKASARSLSWTIMFEGREYDPSLDQTHFKYNLMNANVDFENKFQSLLIALKDCSYADVAYTVPKTLESLVTDPLTRQQGVVWTNNTLDMQSTWGQELMKRMRIVMNGDIPLYDAMYVMSDTRQFATRLIPGPACSLNSQFPSRSELMIPDTDIEAGLDRTMPKAMGESIFDHPYPSPQSIYPPACIACPYIHHAPAYVLSI